jgi:neutral ceramidase
MKVIFLTLFLASALSSPAIEVGFAERDITPEIGMERPGNYIKAFHKALHDPCKVRVVVFHDGRRKVALIGIDALVIRRPQVIATRKEIHEKTGIAEAAILIAATHSHSSGPTGMLLPGEFDHADEFVQNLAYNESTLAHAGYLKKVELQIVAAAVAANNRLALAHVGFGSGKEDGITYNRRFKMKNGMMFTMPRQGNPDMVEPAGPIDPEVGVIAVWADRRKEKLLGCIVNFSCHATTNPAGISANYVYYLERTIRSIMGEDAIVVFMAGASGDINCYDNRSPFLPYIGDRAAKLVGGQLGAEANKVMLHAGLTGRVNVGWKQQVLRIPRRHPDPARVKIAREYVGANKITRENRTEWIFHKETVLLDSLLKKESIRDVEVQAIQIGPAVFVTTPAEYFCQFGLDQKAGSKFPFTYPVSLANGCVGYVPTEEALGRNGGGYETRLTSYSNLIPTAGRLLADTGIELANSLKPDPVPSPAPAFPFKGSWGYGNVPPELE